MDGLACTQLVLVVLTLSKLLICRYCSCWKWKSGILLQEENLSPELPELFDFVGFLIINVSCASNELKVRSQTGRHRLETPLPHLFFMHISGFQAETLPFFIRVLCHFQLKSCVVELEIQLKIPFAAVLHFMTKLGIMTSREWWNQTMCAWHWHAHQFSAFPISAFKFNITLTSRCWTWHYRSSCDEISFIFITQLPPPSSLCIKNVLTLLASFLETPSIVNRITR